MQVIGTAAVAKILGLSTRTTIRQVEAGLIPLHGKLGGDKRPTLLFDRDAIIRLRDDRFAERRRQLDEEIERLRDVAS